MLCEPKDSSFPYPEGHCNWLIFPSHKLKKACLCQAGLRSFLHFCLSRVIYSFPRHNAGQMKPLDTAVKSRGSPAPGLRPGWGFPAASPASQWQGSFPATLSRPPSTCCCWASAQAAPSAWHTPPSSPSTHSLLLHLQISLEEALSYLPPGTALPPRSPMAPRPCLDVLPL